MKVQRMFLLQIKDYLRSLPPNVLVPTLGAEEREDY